MQKGKGRNAEGVLGVDEVGRGALAGPVVAAAVIFLPSVDFPRGIVDSKLLKEPQREAVNEELWKLAERGEVFIGIGIRSPTRICETNILKATYEAMTDAVVQVRSSGVAISKVLVDGNTVPPQLHGKCTVEAVVGGDRKHFPIAAASIVAKVWRDQKMKDYAATWPDYFFEANKGYGTKQHLAALTALGRTCIHRPCFNRVPSEMCSSCKAGDCVHGRLPAQLPMLKKTPRTSRRGRTGTPIKLKRKTKLVEKY